MYALRQDQKPEVGTQLPKWWQTLHARTHTHTHTHTYKHKCTKCEQHIKNIYMCSKAVAHTKSHPDLTVLLSFSRTIKTTTLATLQKNVSTVSGITSTPGQIVNDHTFQTQDISHCFNSVTPTPPLPWHTAPCFCHCEGSFPWPWRSLQPTRAQWRGDDESWRETAWSLLAVVCTCRRCRHGPSILDEDAKVLAGPSQTVAPCLTR